MKMYRTLILLLLVLLITPASPGERVWVWLKDKGTAPTGLLPKNSMAYQAARNCLSEQSITRRAKISGGSAMLDATDLPINPDYVARLEQAGMVIVHQLRWFNAVSGYLPAAAVSVIRSLPFVDSITAVRRLYRKDRQFIALQPDNPRSATTGYSFSYTQLALSNVPRLHSAGITGSGVTVGVLDAGFDWRRHEALNSRTIKGEYDFVFRDSVTADQSNDQPGQHNHGTYVFSILGGYKDSAMVGAAYGATFLLAKTEDIRSEKHIEEDNYAAALQWLDSAGADITSSSLGYNLFDAGQGSYTRQDMNGNTAITTKAVELAFAKGILTFTAAGNEGDDPWYYILAPADGFNVIAVGSVGSDDSVSAFSSRGPTADGRIKPDVVTMGGGVYGAQASTVSGYIFNSGTSAATPIASGIGALLLSTHPYLSNVDARRILRTTARSANHPNNIRGYGLLDAAAAVSYPVVEKTSGGAVILHKLFMNTLRKVQSVKLVLQINGGVKDSIPMAVSGQGFKVALPLLAANDKIVFTFTAIDTAGAVVEDPAGSSVYTVFYGNTEVNVLRPGVAVTADVAGRNFPNPFMRETVIEFTTAAAVQATVEVYSLLGEKVRSLKAGITAAGTNRINWNGRSDSGSLLPAGVYICRIVMPSGVYTNKMVLAR